MKDLFDLALEQIAEGIDPNKAKNIWPTDRYSWKNRVREARDPSKDPTYTFFTPELEEFVFNDTPSYLLIRSGEGFGKTASACIKTLDKIRRGCIGAVASPDFQNFKKSLWPEFKSWIYPEYLVEKDRYKLSDEWVPREAFTLRFIAENGMVIPLYLGGIADPITWEGMTLNFFHLDEARQFKDDAIMKFLPGRMRGLASYKGEPIPQQVYITTTPMKHWLYDYFGNIDPDDIEYDPDVENLYPKFKENAKDYRFSTRLNTVNPSTYYETRAASLTDDEILERLEGHWVDFDGENSFLPNITLWTRLAVDKLPEISSKRRVVAGLDASKTNDWTALSVVCRDPSNRDNIIILEVLRWVPSQFANGRIDFEVIEDAVIKLKEKYNLVCLAYDPYEAEYLTQRLRKKAHIWCTPFSQMKERSLADKRLFDMIMDGSIIHDGNEILTQAVKDAGKKEDNSNKLRIIKKSQSGKIDPLIATSMAVSKCMELATF